MIAPLNYFGKVEPNHCRGQWNRRGRLSTQKEMA